MTATIAKSAPLAYYNFDRVYSYNAAYMYVIGARGLGKTYGAKKRVIKNYIAKKEQFIYLRRYSTELKGRITFFADIAHEFPEWNFRVHGSVAQIAKASTGDETGKKRKWETIGYFVQLSNAQAQKSVAYPAVTTIIFDEFIIEKSALHYLPNEAKAFNDFYSTVDRWKDKTRVLFLANAVSIMNPYFLEYKIMPNEKTGEILTAMDGFIVAHFADSAEFATGVYKTKFGKFIQGSEYATFSVGSEFLDNNGRMLGTKPPEAKYYCSIETKQGTFSVWIDYRGPFYFIQEKRPKTEMLYTMVPELMESGKYLMVYSDKVVQYLRSAFKGGKVWFDTPKARNAFTEIFKR